MCVQRGFCENSSLLWEDSPFEGIGLYWQSLVGVGIDDEDVQVDDDADDEEENDAQKKNQREDL